MGGDEVDAMLGLGGQRNDAAKVKSEPEDVGFGGGLDVDEEVDEEV